MKRFIELPARVTADPELNNMNNGAIQLYKDLSPFNEQEDNSSEPKVKVCIGFSAYSDIAFIAICDKDGDVIADYSLRVTKDGIKLNKLIDLVGTEVMLDEISHDEINKYAEE